MQAKVKFFESHNFFNFHCSIGMLQLNIFILIRGIQLIVLFTKPKASELPSFDWYHSGETEKMSICNRKNTLENDENLQDSFSVT